MKKYLKTNLRHVNAQLPIKLFEVWQGYGSYLFMSSYLKDSSCPNKKDKKIYSSQYYDMIHVDIELCEWELLDDLGKLKCMCESSREKIGENIVKFKNEFLISINQEKKMFFFNFSNGWTLRVHNKHQFYERNHEYFSIVVYDQYSICYSDQKHFYIEKTQR